jgi:hypothetical protein
MWGKFYQRWAVKPMWLALWRVLGGDGERAGQMLMDLGSRGLPWAKLVP